MEKAVYDVVRKMVDQSLSSEDFEARVKRVFGLGMLTEARALAVELRGLDWLYPSADQVPEAAPTRATLSYNTGLALVVFTRKPSSMALVFGAFIVALTVFFPPFVVPLQQGLVTNAGFSYLFSPPEYGSLHAIVNIPLLALLVAAEVFVTVGLYFAFRSVESARR